LRVLPTVRFLAVQFNPIQQPLMAVGILPITDTQTEQGWELAAKSQPAPDSEAGQRVYW
jgi:hypothetical protein